MVPRVYPSTFPKAILFDWDNTLVETCSTTFRGLNAALRSVGLDTLTFEDFLSKPPLALRAFFKNLLGQTEIIHAEDVFHKTIEKEHLSELCVLEGSSELLEWLAGKPVYMAVVSNKKGDILRKEVSHLGWDKHFRDIVGSHDTHEDKPSPVPLLHALRQHIEGPGHHVWFVGDSIVDMECAHRSGCVPVSVGPQADLHHHPTIKAKNCLGLHQLLRSLVSDITPETGTINKT